MTEAVRDFVKHWISSNVRNVPGLEDQNSHVDHLVVQLTCDASAAGFTSSMLTDEVGDLKDYLDNEYLNVHDPDEGGF